MAVPLRRKIRFCDDIVYSEKEIMPQEKAAGVVSGGGRFMWHLFGKQLNPHGIIDFSIWNIVAVVLHNKRQFKEKEQWRTRFK